MHGEADGLYRGPTGDQVDSLFKDSLVPGLSLPFPCYAPSLSQNVELGNDVCAWRSHKRYSVNFLIVSTHVLYP